MKNSNFQKFELHMLSEFCKDDEKLQVVFLEYYDQDCLPYSVVILKMKTTTKLTTHC